MSVDGEPPAEAVGYESDRRLHSVEGWMRLSQTEDRVAVVRWLSRTLSRPPLSRPGSLEPIAGLLDALRYDIGLWCIDPLSPLLPDGRMIPQPHPLLAEPLDELTPRSATTVAELKDALGWS